jgi:hypothetical protein
VLRRKAEMTPMVSPSASSHTNPPAISSSVAGSRETISSDTSVRCT